MTNDPVKQKIVELLPEILELKFGCRIEDFGTLRTICGYRAGGDYLTDDGYWWTYSMLTQRKYLDILGRPITLADVLRAILKRYSPFAQSVVFGASDVQELLGMFNLTTDYDGQTQEVKDFIGKLIGV